MATGRRILLWLSMLGLLAAGTPSLGAAPRGADPAQADAVMRIVRDHMAEAHLKAVIVRVSVDGREVVTEAVGESMTGVAATTDMHFRNGAVAISLSVRGSPVKA